MGLESWRTQRRRQLIAGLLSALAASGVGSTAASASAPIPTADSCAVVVPEPPANRPRYTVQMTVDPSTGIVAGRMTISFQPDLPIDRVVIRLWPNGGVRDATAPSIVATNTQIGVNGATPKPVLASTGDPTILRLAVSAKPADTVTTQLNFSLKLRGERSDRISLSRTGKTFTAARLGSFLPVLAWEFGVGWNLTPATRSGAEASMTATADWDVRVTLPDQTDLAILASGEEIEPGHWVSEAQRDWAMSIGRYRADNGSLSTSTISLGPGRRTVRVTVGVTAPLTESASAYKSRVIKSMRSLSDRYGDYPWPTFTLAITPGLKGGIEYPSHVMQGPGSIGRTTTHEVAHQWFYGLIGNDQGKNPWIDEGLATWAEARTDNTLSAFVAKSIPADGKRKTGLPMTYWDRHRSSYYRSVYVQTLQALASLGAPDEVDCALRTLITNSGHQVVTNKTVIDALTTRFPQAPEQLSAFGIDP
jgi:hypothetical protein